MRFFLPYGRSRLLSRLTFIKQTVRPCDCIHRSGGTHCKKWKRVSPSMALKCTRELVVCPASIISRKSLDRRFKRPRTK